MPQDRIAFNQPLLLLVCLHLHIKYGFRNHDAMSVVFLRKNFHSNARLAANMGLFLGTFQPWPETDLPSDDPIASLHCDQKAGNLSYSGFCASIKLCSLGFTIRIEMSIPTLANRCHQQRAFSRKDEVFSRKELNQRNFGFILLPFDGLKVEAETSVKITFSLDEGPCVGDVACWCTYLSLEVKRDR